MFKLVARFGGGSQHNSGGVVMHNVNTFNDQIFMTLIYPTHITSSQKVEKYAHMLKDVLKRHCSE